MLFLNKFKLLIYIFLFLMWYFFIFNLDIASAFSTDVVNNLHKGAIYPGQTIYYSTYIFDMTDLYFLTKYDFLSSADVINIIPPFDHFYCKVLLPNTNELGWAIVSFVDTGCNITSLSTNMSLAIDSLLEGVPLKNFEPGVTNLDWKIVFSDKISVTFMSSDPTNGIKIYYNISPNTPSSFCKI